MEINDSLLLYYNNDSDDYNNDDDDDYNKDDGDGDNDDGDVADNDNKLLFAYNLFSYFQIHAIFCTKLAVVATCVLEMVFFP